ncbi:MAG: beta-glucosidase [Phycisphaerales bacterium]|nr:MAG: beta-glucosidase [Phycisphaerales bacterium]
MRLARLAAVRKEVSLSFPEDFVWGAAAAAYQIEGAAREDGRGPCVWDRLCRRDGAIWGGHTGDVACDHYHRYREDVELMRWIGLKAYRLSISWPRVLPDGAGAVNPMGVDFYDRLVDELLAAGVTPYVTLFHWDFPLALYERGGWLNRESAEWFAEYAKVVADRLSDRVGHWLTLNEPQVFVSLGHFEGVHAPGDKLTMKQALQVGHHALLGHGKAVQAVRAAARGPCQIGFAPVAVVKTPATDTREDIEAARRSMFAANDETLFNNSWWMDPPLWGRYPEDGLAVYGSSAPQVRDGDMEAICQPLDFFGVNVYSGQTVRAGTDGPETVPLEVGGRMTAMRWAVAPQVLRWGPTFLHERYHLPIHITENGMSNVDWVSLDGRVHDPQRIDFLWRYLLELGKAIGSGVDVRGYFHWSILDNFEWAEGYRERFGLIYVDYPTQRRIPKDSAAWYREVIASNGRTLFDPGACGTPGSGQTTGRESESA